MKATEELKTQLRGVAARRVEAFITTNKRIESDFKIIENIRELEIYKKAKVVLSYYPSMNEPMITELFNDQGKTFYFPKITPDGLAVGTGRLAIGKLGIYEPITTTNITEFDILLIPGAAFDVNLNRLGRGRGYFDRFLANAKGFKLGVAYEAQIFATVPVEAHDIKMDAIVTEQRIIRKSEKKK